MQRAHLLDYTPASPLSTGKKTFFSSKKFLFSFTSKVSWNISAHGAAIEHERGCIRMKKSAWMKRQRSVLTCTQAPSLSASCVLEY